MGLEVGSVRKDEVISGWLITAIGLLCFAVSPVGAAAQTYTTHLESIALNPAQRPNVNGEGDVRAVLDGHNLMISGTFQRLPTPATRARIFRGVVVGAPGDPILDLTVSPDTSGTISGTEKLSSEQVRALREERLYIQIDLVGAPGTVSGAFSAPNGTVWGWLMPEHEVPAQDVPQSGSWFLQ